MRRPSRSAVGPFLVAALSLAAPAPADPQDSTHNHTTNPPAPAETGPPSNWPCRLIVDGELKPLVILAWELSATFRQQCRTLAAAGAAVILRAASARFTMRAETRIAVHTDRTIVAHVRVRPGDRAVEHIAHEIEHVIERIEGVNLLMESTRGGSGVSMGAGAFETRRAVEAGRRVASEAPQATRRQAR